MKYNILLMNDIDVVAVCDEYEDRVKRAQDEVEEQRGIVPFGTTDYHELVKREDVEAVLICAAWEAHTQIAVASMRAGKYTGVEVGGAYAIEDCWRLVHTSEETGVPCMMMENCCYGQKELMCLKMAKENMFGEIVHCTGGYHHDLRDEVAKGNEIRHYRLRNYTLRNCDNYLTHQLGPIAKILNINRGNRMVSLTSTASKSVGLHEYVVKKYGEDSDLAKLDFKQGDVITTVINCAGGETIRLTLGTTTPRAYSRDFSVTGSCGYYEEATNSIYLERDADTYERGEFGEVIWRNNWDNAKTRYEDEFIHPIWKKYKEDGIKAGHGGMDWLVLRAFFESAMEKVEPPIDVYDTAAWMCISVLSEKSIRLGGAVVEIPDFTSGKWIKERDKERKQIESYRLDKIPSEVDIKG